MAKDVSKIRLEISLLNRRLRDAKRAEKIALKIDSGEPISFDEWRHVSIFQGRIEESAPLVPCRTYGRIFPSDFGHNEMLYQLWPTGGCKFTPGDHPMLMRGAAWVMVGKYGNHSWGAKASPRHYAQVLADRYARRFLRPTIWTRAQFREFEGELFSKIYNRLSVKHGMIGWVHETCSLNHWLAGYVGLDRLVRGASFLLEGRLVELQSDEDGFVNPDVVRVCYNGLELAQKLALANVEIVKNRKLRQYEKAAYGIRPSRRKRNAIQGKAGIG